VGVDFDRFEEEGGDCMPGVDDDGTDECCVMDGVGGEGTCRNPAPTAEGMGLKESGNVAVFALRSGLNFTARPMLAIE
jgi:hypothetical protein